jgi:hypothetical protein
MPPILALYARFVRTQCTEQPPWATIPTIGIRSNRNSSLQGLGPLRQSNYKDEHVTPATGPRMTGRITTPPKDRNHSTNSGAHAWTRNSSTQSIDAMPPQCRPRRHQIRLSRGSWKGSRHTSTSCNSAPPWDYKRNMQGPFEHNATEHNNSELVTSR